MRAEARERAAALGPLLPVEPGGRGQKSAGRLPLGVAFDKELCRGCGLCATGCPDGAIAMAPLADGR